jgi:hypothetical protein
MAFPLIKGHIFGGGSGMLYSGTYDQNGNNVSARVHVERFAATTGMQRVRGANTFDLDLSGTVGSGSV